MLVSIRGTEPVQDRGLPTLLAAGFRPFFLLGGAYAALAVVLWIAGRIGGMALPTWCPGPWLHGHEMLFGFTSAVIAGFLLTAAPKWTGRDAPKGRWLGALALAWVLGRVATWSGGSGEHLPAAVVPLVESAFFVPLALWVGWAVYGTANRRNYIIPVLVATLWAADLAFHLQLSGVFAHARPIGLYGGIYVVVILMVLISGRIVPAFTASALRRAESTVTVGLSPRLGMASLAACGLALAADLFDLHAAGLGFSGLAAALLLVLRARAWRLWHCRSDPLLWILHLGHAWLVVGFVALGLRTVDGFEGSTIALHAFTAGAIGTLVLGVTTRAALGHSGRKLAVSGGVVAAYTSLTGAAILRVAADALSPGGWAMWILASGLLWVLAFAGFVVLYWPILTRPRIDGRPG